MRVKLIRSSNGCTKIQKDNLRSLNLKRIGDVVELNEDAATLGRLRIVRHLVNMEKSK